MKGKGKTRANGKKNEKPIEAYAKPRERFTYLEMLRVKSHLGSKVNDSIFHLRQQDRSITYGRREAWELLKELEAQGRIELAEYGIRNMKDIERRGYADSMNVYAGDGSMIATPGKTYAVRRPFRRYWTNR